MIGPSLQRTEMAMRGNRRFMEGLARASLAGLILVRPVSHDPAPPSPVVTYALQIEAAHVDQVDVAVRFRDAPSSFHLAMKVHAEYDARYWRYISDLRVDSTASDSRAGVRRQDSTLWLITLPGGRGIVHYRVAIQPAPTGLRHAWRTYARANGALINPPDVFLYSPELATSPIRLELSVPHDWRIATALPSPGPRMARTAPDAAALLDSPILAGHFYSWAFTDRGTAYRVAYWPLPDASPFDTVALVAELRALARVTGNLFGGAPVPTFDFLLQDGASDALEHGASVIIGVPSADIARDAHASITEITHEFFHTWNLVAIRPAGYNDLSYRPPARTPSLWLGEGVTIYYADALPRRAGLVDSSPSRLGHLGDLLGRYYASPAILRVPPTRSSLAFGDSPVTNPDATGGYYLQGELIADALEAHIRDSTRDARGFDEVMRALYARSQRAGYRGYTPGDVREIVDSICACRMASFFDTQVDGVGPIDLSPTVSRLGVRLVLDSVPATDSAGRPAPDLRLGTSFAPPPAAVTVIITNPATVWAVAGLRTGDELLTLNGAPIRNFGEKQAALNQLRIGDSALVGVRRNGASLQITVRIAGYLTPRIRFVDASAITPAQLEQRRKWLAGE